MPKDIYTPNDHCDRAIRTLGDSPWHSELYKVYKAAYFKALQIAEMSCGSFLCEDHETHDCRFVLESQEMVSIERRTRQLESGKHEYFEYSVTVAVSGRCSCFPKP